MSAFAISAISVVIAQAPPSSPPPIPPLEGLAAFEKQDTGLKFFVIGIAIGCAACIATMINMVVQGLKGPPEPDPEELPEFHYPTGGADIKEFDMGHGKVPPAPLKKGKSLMKKKSSKALIADADDKGKDKAGEGDIEEGKGKLSKKESSKDLKKKESSKDLKKASSSKDLKKASSSKDLKKSSSSKDVLKESSSKSKSKSSKDKGDDDEDGTDKPLLKKKQSSKNVGKESSSKSSSKSKSKK